MQGAARRAMLTSPGPGGTAAEGSSTSTLAGGADEGADGQHPYKEACWLR